MIKKKFNFMEISPYLRYIHTDITPPDAVNETYIVPWRCIYDYELVFLYEGELHIKTEYDEYTLHAGDLHIMPPFTRHSRKADKGAMLKLYSVHFDLIYMGPKYDFSAYKVYSEPCDKHATSVDDDIKLLNRPYYLLNNVELPQKIKVNNTFAYLEILEKALKIYNSKPFGYELDTKICLLQILRMLIDDMHNLNISRHLLKNDVKLIDCINYINTNFSKDIDFEKLAKDHGFTLSYFRKLYRESTGKPCNEYLIDLRIENAIEYIKTGMYSVSEVCRMVGYNDIHYFSRLFKRKKGFSPSMILK